MKRVSFLAASALGTGVLGIAVLASLNACSSPNASSGGGGGGACTSNALNVLFAPMYSAFDGQHEFTVPAVVSGVNQADITWTASDPTMVQIQPDSDTGGVLITTQKAG